jgi:hypothetical protein
MAVRMISEFKVSDIAASKPGLNKYGGKYIYLNGPNKSRLMFQMPPLKAIVGLSSKVGDDEKTQYSMPLSMDHPDVVRAFSELDNYCLDLIAANSEFLLGKKMTREVLEAGDSWKPKVKPPKDEKYAPLLDMKPIVDRKTGEIQTEAYNSKRELVPLNTLEKGQRVSCIIEISQIWKSSMGVGVSVRLHQVMFAPTTKLAPCAFLASADEPVADSASERSADEAVEEEEAEEEAEESASE